MPKRNNALHWAEIHAEMYKGTPIGNKWEKKAQRIRERLTHHEQQAKSTTQS